MKLKDYKGYKKIPCHNSNLQNAVMQYSALPVKLQCLSVKSRQTAIVSLHIYIFGDIVFLWSMSTKKFSGIASQII